MTIIVGTDKSNSRIPGTVYAGFFVPTDNFLSGYAANTIPAMEISRAVSYLAVSRSRHLLPHKNTEKHLAS